jgi:hypothetical protein
VAGNGIGMPMAPKLGRTLTVAGLVALLAGTLSMIFVVTHFGMGLTPWHMVIPVVLYGAGLGLGASSLMFIVLFGAGQADSGAVSGVVNTVVQLGVAAGPATVGTVFFSGLAADGDFVAATRTSLVVGLVLFVVALCACFALPRRNLRV